MFPDGSTYEGDFKNDIIEGFGKFHWEHKDCTYEGSWKDGRLEGKGHFTNAEGFKREGDFYNNYFKAEDLFINPFMSAEEEKINSQI